MTISFRKTLTLLRNGLLNPAVAWREYYKENSSWQQTALRLTLPLVASATVLGVLVHGLLRDSYLYAATLSAQMLLIDIALTFVLLLITALVFSYTAGKFAGQSSFSRSLAAITLAAIPAFAGMVIIFVPWLGWLVALALLMLSIVCLYQVIPLYLQVPDGKRRIHFLVSLVSTLIAVIIFNWIVAAVFIQKNDDLPRKANITASSGTLAQVNESMLLLEDALNDVFTPPENNEITDQQMQAFVMIMQKTHKFLEQRVKELRLMADELENKEDKSISEIMKMSRKIGENAMSQNDAEMRIVKRGGQNWKEHQWIKQQLRIAATRQPGMPGVAHNRKMYKNYSKELSELGFNP